MLSSLPLSIVIDINPILLQLGPLAVRWYGLMYVVGIAAGLYVAMPYAKQRGLDEEKIMTMFWWGLIAALVGARLYYVAQQPDLTSFLVQPWRIFAMWEGGMAFYGAIAGAIIALAIGCRWEKVSFWTLADAGAIFAVVGQAFGRIGNLINGDIVGYPTDLPWGFIYQNPGSFVNDHTVAYQPAAVYELIFNLLFFAVLWTLRFRLRKSGLLFATYLILYSIGQFLIFFLRANEIVFWGLKNAQFTALLVMLAAVPLWVWLNGRGSEGQALVKADQHN